MNLILDDANAIPWIKKENLRSTEVYAKNDDAVDEKSLFLFVFKIESILYRYFIPTAATIVAPRSQKTPSKSNYQYLCHNCSVCFSSRGDFESHYRWVLEITNVVSPV